MRSPRLAVFATLFASLGACSSGEGDGSADTSANLSNGDTIAPTSAKCVVRLHGKGGAGAATETIDDITYISPTGNDSGWGGRQWLYFPDERYDEAREVVRSAIDHVGCERVVIHGFSNGGAFAAMLVCRGESFDGRVAGFLIDDPVPDQGVIPCGRDEATPVALYWTGALDATAAPGTGCAGIDWTCAGGSLVGIDAYAAALGVETTPSAQPDHSPFWDAPEPTEWLARSSGDR